MVPFSFQETSMEGLFLINSFSIDDNRGYFVKDFEKEVFLQNGIDIDFYESFESCSQKNVVRGLHFQTKEPQAKLVRTVTGEIFDVAVDLRKDSKTFGKWEGFHLSEDNRKSLFIPEGFAHGFLVLSEKSIVSYKCVGKYHKDFDTGILWNDLDLRINWGVKNPIVSERDSKLMTFETFLQQHGSI